MSMTSEPERCPQCGGLIASEAPQGLCPKCLLMQASIPTEAGQNTTTKPGPPTREELAAAFPQLEVLELIGQGGMGFVFKARQPKLDRLVALKILPQSLAADPAFAERFTREGRVLARLNHPNIVTIHDFGVTSPQPIAEPEGNARRVRSQPFYYLLMEFVDGVNLRQAMKAGRFAPAQALAIVPKICEALQFAHSEGILHRDIKPENILLDAKGRVKIADFGIAKLVQLAGDRSATVPSGANRLEDPNAPGASPAPQTLTETGKVLGTPNYMAPEQLETPGEVDHRADIYSLGVVFYEMLTGELPIGRFAPPSEKSGADPRLDEVVLHTLEKERERRTQSAGEVKTQVDTIAATPQPGRSSTSSPPAPRRAGGRGWKIAAAIVAGVMLILAIPAGLWIFYRFAGRAQTAVQSGLLPEITQALGGVEGNVTHWLDLDTGHQMPLSFPSEDGALQALLRTNGLDIMAVVTDREVGVSCRDTEIQRVDNSLYEKATAEEIIAGTRSGPVRLPDAAVVVMTNPRKRATMFFRTRENGCGILQITGRSDQPRGVKLRYKLVAPAAFSFGPVIDRMIHTSAGRTNCLITFSTGELSTIPPEVGLSAAGLHGYIRRQGADAAAGLFSSIGLAGFDMAVVPAPAPCWEVLSPVQAAKRLASEANSPLGIMSYGQPSALPSTCVFKTHGGGIGILQVTEIAADPPGLKVRYKFLDTFPFAVQTETPSTAGGTWTPNLLPGEAPDMDKIRQEANDLAATGHYDEALQRHRWYHDHAKEFSKLDWSIYVLPGWEELGRRYPKAKQALIEIRDRQTRDIAEGRGYADMVREVGAINRELQDDDATVSLFKTIREKDPKLAKQCYRYLQDSLVSRGEFELCLASVGDPQAAFDSCDRYSMGTNYFVREVSTLIEILVGAGHKADAEKIRDQAIATLDDPRLKTAIDHAEEEVRRIQASLHPAPITLRSQGVVNLASLNTNPPSASVLQWSPALASGKEPDRREILGDATDLMSRGQYEESLQRRLWLLNHALEYGHSYDAVTGWEELGRRYPKAKQALIETRDIKIREIAEGRGYTEMLKAVAMINHELDNDDATHDLFKFICAKDPKLARQSYYWVEDLLISKGDYESCLTFIGDPQASFEFCCRMLEMQSESQRRLDEARKKFKTPEPARPIGAYASPSTGQMATNYFVGRICKLTEILVGANRKADAEKIRDQAVAVIDDARLKSAVADAERKIHK